MARADLKRAAIDFAMAGSWVDWPTSGNPVRCQNSFMAPDLPLRARYAARRPLCICSPPGQENFFLAAGDPVVALTAPPPELDEAAQAAFIARSRALAPQYRTELLRPQAHPLPGWEHRDRPQEPTGEQAAAFAEHAARSGGHLPHRPYPAGSPGVGRRASSAAARITPRSGAARTAKPSPALARIMDISLAASRRT